MRRHRGDEQPRHRPPLHFEGSENKGKDVAVAQHLDLRRQAELRRPDRVQVYLKRLGRYANRDDRAI